MVRGAVCPTSPSRLLDGWGRVVPFGPVVLSSRPLHVAYNLSARWSPDRATILESLVA